MEDVIHWSVEDKILTWILVDDINFGQAWGDPLKMHPSILLLLNNFSGTLPPECSIKIHSGFKSLERVRNANSYHCKARAVDFHVEGCSFLRAEQYLMTFLNSKKILLGKECRLSDHVGLGIYIEWRTPGFHLDTRGFMERWAHINGEYVEYETGIEKAKEMNI